MCVCVCVCVCVDVLTVICNNIYSRLFNAKSIFIHKKFYFKQFTLA